MFLFQVPFNFFFFFFNDTATTEIYTLSLHDALPISSAADRPNDVGRPDRMAQQQMRSEEHTSELQSRRDLVCRLLLEKKKKHQYGPRRLPSQPQQRPSHEHLQLD